MRLFIRISLLIVLLVTVSSCRSCWPGLPPARSSDAGDYSFARQAVPKLTGRKAKGYAEVKVIADLISQSDRPTVVSAMLRQESFKREYIEHWSENVVDFMRVHRETAKQQTESDECLGPGLRTQPDYSPALAQFVRDNVPTAAAPPGGNYNLSDLLRSSLALDDLSPVFRAYLFAMVNYPISGAEVTQQNQRDDLGATLTRVYTHRQITCLQCHTTTQSTTGQATFWNRHFPIWGQFSTALFGSGRGRPTDEVHAMLRTDVSGGASRPWGISNCGSFVPAANVSDDTLTNPDGTPVEAFFTRNRGRRGSVWALEETLNAGYQRLITDGLVRSVPQGSSAARCNYCSGSATCPNGTSTTVPPLDPVGVARENEALNVLRANCFSCHEEGDGGLQMDETNFKTQLIGIDSMQDSSQLLVSPGNAGASYVITKIDSPTANLPNGTRRMPRGLPQMSAADRDRIRAWINGLSPAAGCASCDANGCSQDRVNGDAAFAFLTAGRVVENTWEEMMGSKLTVPNYFPRNAAQMSILWNLTESEFVPSRWSMQRILTRILTSDYFNRQAPEQSTGPSAYELPLYLDPWVAGDPRLPPIALPGTPPGSNTAPSPDPNYDPNTEPNRPRHYNSMGEGVHRYSPRSLFQSVHAALGWPSPKREASGSYPDDNLRKSMGQFYRDAEPGFREIGFQGLLNWEGVHGRCMNPGTTDDWIDRLIAEIPNFNNNHPTDRVRIRDVVLALKDRLLADASLQSTTPTGVSQTENALFEALFGTTLTNEPNLVDAIATNEFEQRVRDTCGVLLETPQFMLAGIAPIQLGERPRLQVCLPGEPCGYQAVCNSYVAAFDQMGYLLTCRDDSLTLGPKPDGPSPKVTEEFCPRGRCGVVPWDIPRKDLCLTDPRGCFRDPPMCDPRCAQIDCCGGPLPPLEGKELFLFWADKGRVQEAVGVKILRDRQKPYETLMPGDELNTGQILVLTAESQMQINTPEGTFRMPKGGLGKGQTYWVVQITGPQALRPTDQQRLIPVKIDAALDFSRKAYWLVQGEAGPPTVPNQRKASSNVLRRARNPRPTPMAPKWEGLRNRWKRAQ